MTLFGSIRFFLWLAVLLICFILLRKSNIRHKRRVFFLSLASVIVLGTISYIVPVENALITFQSPESAFHYTNSGDIKLVLEGQNTDMVISSKNEIYTYILLPKNNNGWKIGSGADIKTIAKKTSEDVIVDVYQYKNSNDYFITVFVTNGGAADVSDNQESTFYSLSQYNDVLESYYNTYYAHIQNWNDQYILIVNGETMNLHT